MQKNDEQIRKEVTREYLQYYLDVIEDEGLRKMVKRALRSAPQYFWTKGIYVEGRTPEDEQVKHGVVRRVAKCCYFAKNLLRAWNIIQLQDIIIAAALLHECMKFESPDQKQHGPFTANWLCEVWEIQNFVPGEHNYNSTGLDTKLRMVIDVVRMHDGVRWSEEEVLKPIGDTLSPVEVAAWLVHTCEFLSSRTRVVFEW